MIVQVEKLKKEYQTPHKTITILNNLDLTINKGDFVSVQGISGVGKSTLLNILGALDSPTKGKVICDGYKLHNKLSNQKIESYRKKSVGFIFQNHFLMSDFTVLENVMLPLRILGIKSKIAEETARNFLVDVGMEHRINFYPDKISGGESQRVATARALVKYPSLILADEPTGNLDNKNTQNFAELLKKLQESYGLTILMVTHDINLAKIASRRLYMIEGQLKKFSDFQS